MIKKIIIYLLLIIAIVLYINVIVIVLKIPGCNKIQNYKKTNKKKIKKHIIVDFLIIGTIISILILM